MLERVKRVLALFLCAVMLLGMIPSLSLAVTAYAEEESDFESEESQSGPATDTPARSNFESCTHKKDTSGYCTVATCGHGTDCYPKKPKESTYTIVYHSNDGKDETLRDTAVVHAPVTLKGAVFSREGYTFQGWSNGKTTYDGGQEIATGLASGGTVDLYAVWAKNPDPEPEPEPEEPRYTIVYHSNYGSDETSTYSPLVGDTFTLKGAVFSREGYTFQGWSYTPNGEVQRAGGEEVHGGLTQTVGATVDLYAVWAEVEKAHYTIVYHGNGGVLASNPDKNQSTSTATVGEEVILKNAATFVREGYTFQGWSGSPNGAVKYAGSEKVATGLMSEAGSVDLYAVWTKVVSEVKVNFDLGGGHGFAASKTLIVDEPYGDLPQPPQIWKKGYTFAGWFLGREEVTSATIVELNVEHTLRAYWKKAGVCTVTFDSNGHGSYTRAVEVRYGKKCPKPRDPVDRHYAFTGWYTDPACKNRYDFSRPVTHDMTLYAGWSDSYTLTFVGNGGTEFDQIRVLRNTVVDLSDFKPVRSGYYFCGWYTSKWKIERNRVTSLLMDSDKTVYAMWARRSH